MYWVCLYVAGATRATREAQSSSSSSTSASSSSSAKKPRLDQIAPANLDADDPQDSNSDDDSDSDDDATLVAELEHIRKERAEEEDNQQRIRHKNQERIRMENIISGNPLLNFTATKADMKVRRRWDDDVVFKNCAATEPDAEQKSYINDSLRSEFHKRFMEKYVKWVDCCNAFYLSHESESSRTAFAIYIIFI